MSLTTSEMTPADFGAIMGNNNGGMFGGDGAWWLIVLFLFIFAGGWGNRSGYGGGGATDGYILTSDFANIERKIDGVNNGLCDGFYTQAQLINGVNQNISNGFATAELSRANQQTALTNQLFGIQSALQNCCCENREAIANVNYNMATNTRDIIDNQNTNARAILDALNAQQTEALKTRISEQNQQIFALQLASSQSAQNEYLINRLQPSPIPAYHVSPPYQYGGCGCGCNG